jgi:hypothetical protein
LAENIVGSCKSPKAKIEVKTDGIWSRWSDWSKCPLNSCAKIRAFRTRACDAPAPHNGGRECAGEKREERDCANECPIDGGWSKWSECDQKCVQKHERSCTRPKPENGGDECSGIGIEEIPCQGGNCKEMITARLYFFRTIKNTYRGLSLTRIHLFSPHPYFYLKNGRVGFELF